MRERPREPVLGSPIRRRIVSLLRAGELAAGEVAARLELRAPALSHHLAVLRDAQVVEARIDGQKRIYELVPDGALRAWDEWIHHALQTW